jgi:hypothetical protein
LNLALPLSLPEAKSKAQLVLIRSWRFRNLFHKVILRTEMIAIAVAEPDV